jgi:hypothetical protein
MRRGVGILVALAVAAAAAPPAPAAFQKPRSCRSGETVFRDGKVRLFSVEGEIDGEQAWRHYVCSGRLRKPRRFYETSPGLDETLSTVRRSGRRVAFLLVVLGGESFDQALGWVDVRTARTRLSWLDEEDEGPIVRAVVADADGGVAFLQDGEESGQRIGYARLGPRGSLGAPRTRAVIAEGDVIARSLAVADGTITWTTRSGAAGSVTTQGRPDG